MGEPRPAASLARTEAALAGCAAGVLAAAIAATWAAIILD